VTGVQLARWGDPFPPSSLRPGALPPVHGDGSRLVVALEVGLEVGLVVGLELTVPRAPACCARRQGAVAGSTAQGAAGNVRGLWDAMRAWRHHAVPATRSA
jgi:hypothetical protein